MITPSLDVLPLMAFQLVFLKNTKASLCYRVYRLQFDKPCRQPLTFTNYQDDSISPKGESSRTGWKEEDTKDSSHIPDSAYHEAWSSLTKEERKKLSGRKDIGQIFSQLQQTDQKYQDQSLLLRGVKTAYPCLNKLETALDFISPLTSAIPVAQTALGIIKSISSVAIAFCDAANEITSHTASLLERMPVALVNVYKDLLQFYFKTINLLEHSQVFMQMTLGLLKSELTEVISSFNSHANVLSQLVKLETSTACQYIKDKEDEIVILDTLTTNGEHESSYHNESKYHMGCGKTMTTAYVVDVLTEHSPVCAYYCKDDQPSFFDWYEKNNKKGQVIATKDDVQMHEFLYHTLSSSDQWNFIVLDGLDECEVQSRKQLLSLFLDLDKNKVEKPAKKALPDATRIEHNFTPQRDYIIANHLVNIFDISQDISESVVEELSKRANGCAIWLQIAVKYLASARINSQKCLTELYWMLFNKVCADIQDNEKYVERALETLAVSQRPLSITELAYAIFIDTQGDKRMSLAELEEMSHKVNLLELIRPLINIIENRDGEKQIRLLHQSLKELILQAPPSSWNLVGKKNWKSEITKRKAELNERSKSSSGFQSTPEDDHLRGFSGMPDDVGNDKSPIEPQECFDPSDIGRGRFYNYAAPYWTAHFPDTPYDQWQTDFIILCSRGFHCLDNWVEQWELSHVDPIIVAAAFLPVAYLLDLLRCNFQSLELELIRRDCISTIYEILTNRIHGASLRSTTFITNLVSMWSEARTVNGNVAKEWEYIFDLLIEELHEDLLKEGNEILFQAANRGCFPLVKRLFDGSKCDPDLRRAILENNRLKSQSNKEVQLTHQSVGEAAHNHHVDMVNFLCGQPGIEGHLQHRNEAGDTILKTLIQHWPEGINLRNNGNDLPLDVLIFNRNSNSGNTVDTIEIMLAMGKADATGSNDDFGHAPLCSAIRVGDIDVLKMLIKKGSADISCAMRVNEGTGKPFLITDVTTNEHVDYQEMLKQLCMLLPLTVSTKYLC
ncbi:hypothetical protein V8C42DRAFT_358755 [Trichoderma barbatum]